MIPQSSKLVAERQARLDALGPCPPWWRPFARRRWRRTRDAIMAMDVSQYAEMLRAWYPADRLRDLAERPVFALGSDKRRTR